MADWLQVKNWALTTLAAGYTAGDGSMTVADATLLPTAPCRLVVWGATHRTPYTDTNRLIVHVSSILGNVLTISAEHEDTIDADQASGAQIACLDTAGMRNQITAEVDLKAPLISPSLTTPNLGTPSAGTLTNCTGLPIATGVGGLGAGVATFLATPSSANLATAVTDETGSGALVFATSPTLVTPVLGVATATSLNAGSPATPSSGYIYAKMLGAYASGGYAQVKAGSWNDTAGYGNAFTMFRARGTYASPTYCNAGDSVALWYFSSLDTSGAQRAGATLHVALDGSPAANYVPMSWSFLTYDPGGTYATRLQISAYGSIVCGRQAALATNATDGFLYVPTCAGTPSGTPTSYTGKCALVFDTSNNKLYVYDGGWIQVALSA